MARNQPQSALSRFRDMASGKKRLRRSDFTLSGATANERSEIASYRAVKPLELLGGPNDSLRAMLAYHEGFFHDGATTAEQTYSLTQTAVDTSNTVAVEVYADSTRLTRNDSGPNDDEFSVDFTNNQITVDVDTDVTVHVFYYPSEGLELQIVKEKPGNTGTVDEVLYDDITTDLHNRDQNSDPTGFDFNQSAYQGIVPTDWEIVVYTNGAWGVDWDDSDTDTSGSKTVNSVTAVGPILDLPVRISAGEVPGLSREVARDIGTRK